MIDEVAINFWEPTLLSWARRVEFCRSFSSHCNDLLETEPVFILTVFKVSIYLTKAYKINKSNGALRSALSAYKAPTTIEETEHVSFERLFLRHCNSLLMSALYFSRKCITDFDI